MLNKSLIVGALLALLAVQDVAADDAVWAELKQGNRVAFIRHAQTVSGIGDPEGFVIGDCATQRNLSEGGRADAKAIGEAFRRRGIPVAQVLSSRWCRCLDTARLAFSTVKPVVMLDSMFNDRVKPDEEKRLELHAYMDKWKAPGNLVLVTHAQNIQRMTGVSPGSGEIIVTRYEAGRFQVTGRIAPGGK